MPSTSPAPRVALLLHYRQVWLTLGNFSFTAESQTPEQKERTRSFGLPTHCFAPVTTEITTGRCGSPLGTFPFSFTAESQTPEQKERTCSFGLPTHYFTPVSTEIQSCFAAVSPQLSPRFKALLPLFSPLWGTCVAPGWACFTPRWPAGPSRGARPHDGCVGSTPPPKK